MKHHIYFFQLNKMSQFRRSDVETDSTSSAEGSNADSGRGPSEEGDQSKSNGDPNIPGRYTEIG